MAFEYLPNSKGSLIQYETLEDILLKKSGETYLPRFFLKKYQLEEMKVCIISVDKENKLIGIEFFQKRPDKITFLQKGNLVKMKDNQGGAQIATTRHVKYLGILYPDITTIKKFTWNKRHTRLELDMNEAYARKREKKDLKTRTKKATSPI